ncbi:MAG TPA: mandelate racemase/muconate lactonizing enzyme family protein [Tepidisphaeraceae bacterium]|nr:mandelate racemase/muconate lactonizing enzyme family protein [Tepidisphaeraceae bacterium]
MPTTSTRRAFLQSAAAAGVSASLVRAGDSAPATAPTSPSVTKAELDHILDQPVLKTDFLSSPVMVASIEVLRNGRNFLLRTRSTDGIVAITVPNSDRLANVYPLLINQIIPVFLNKDARTLESLLWDVYRYKDNYKFYGLALWVGVAAVEMALLELMGQTTKRPLADFFGGAVRRDIPIYVASGVRGNTPEAEIDHLRQLVTDSGAKALKFRLGGRMSRNADSLPGRTEALIPLVRKTFGDDFTLYADANSSYDVPNALRIGRLMEEHRYGFYEEPVPFDELWETKEVADALTIPIALGEQEASFRRFQFCIQNRVADIIQPDLHYFGGFIRSTKVARMCAAAGINLVPHMSGGSLGYLDVVHFASITPNIGPYMEFKGNTNLPVHCDTSPVKSVDGVVRCPSGPGFGVTIDPGYVAKAKPVDLI